MTSCLLFSRWFAGGLACLVLAVGCQSESLTESTGGPSSMPAAANLQVVNFSVPGMHCEFSCAPKVREVLTQQPGVAEVEVDLASKTAWVKADPDQFDAEAAVAALLDVQFDDTQVITATQAQEARDAAATVTTPEDAS